MITLQSLLNCLDGHTCVEGTLLFMTANNPEKMDYAMVRSCRIDYKLELGYADEYQTRNIYDTFLPEQTENFSKFYKKIKHMEFTTAMLQEFLFYNRNCENILEHLSIFNEIVEKNKPSELATDKKQQNLAKTTKLVFTYLINKTLSQKIKIKRKKLFLHFFDSVF